MKTKSPSFNTKTIENIAKLSNLPLEEDEGNYLTGQFNETLNVIEELSELKTKSIEVISQVTGLKNVFREDRIDKSRVLSQKEALSGSKNTYRGFFVVSAIFDSE